jgi:GntR family transcriptional regulator
MISRESAVPLYHQLYSVLRDEIVAGVQRPGSRLPSERAMTRTYGLSRLTVQRASAELERQGLIVRVQGSGAFVADPLPAMPVSASLQALIDSVAEIGKSTEGRVVELAEVVPERDVRAALRLEPRARIQRSVHVRSRADGPVGLFTTCEPQDIGRGIGARDIEAHPMLVLLERRGVHPAWATQGITAALADRRVASLLQVRTGAALVRLTRVVFDRHDRPVEHLVALYRADRYEHRTVLRRDTDWGRA